VGRTAVSHHQAGLKGVTEAVWQQQVIELAHLLGWVHMHVRRTIGKGNKWTTATSVKGFPDLLLWHEGQQRVMAVELKTETGKLTVEQTEVLRSLGAAGMETYVWRPSDLEAAQAVLARSPR
jgi:VRR-NUC domain